jgi:DNA-binding SARP family transcriptional activator
VSRFEIEILGDVRFRFDGVPWRLVAPPKCLPLLALIAMRRDPIPRAALAGWLWPDESDSDARANLRRHLYALGRALPSIDGVEWMGGASQNVAWNHAAPARIDALVFEELLETGAAAAATQLYRGDFLAGIFDEAIVAERERLRTLQLAALKSLAQQARTARQFAPAAAYAEAILAIDEFREDAVRLLIAVRHASGDRSGALATFERFARRLRDELQADPMFETLALRDAVLANAALDDSGAIPIPVAPSRPFFGRVKELDALSKVWLRAARGHGSAVFLAGEPGIGKSRLADELLQLVDAQGGRSVLGSTSSPESIPYQPVVEALRSIVPFVPREARHEPWLAALVPFVPEIRRLHPDLAEAATLKPEPAKLRLHEAVARAIEVCARIRPLAILLEDVHHAHLETLDLIAALAERITGSPVLLMLTYRSTEVDPDSPLRVLRRTLQRSGLASHHALARLTGDDVAALVESEGIADPGEFAARVFALSDGNPLFAWQLIHHHRERQDAPTEDVAVKTVGEAIRTRLSFLSPDVRSVAEVAATIGEAFTVEEIADVCGSDESAVFAALATLLDRNLIAERAGAAFEYGFTHALIGSVIYDTTGAAARTARHRRAAGVLERTRGTSGRALPLIARHWERGGEPALARAAYLRAARASLERFARDEAIALAAAALALEPPAQERFAALLTTLQATAKDRQSTEADRAIANLEAVATTLGVEERFEAIAARAELHSTRSEREQQGVAIARLVTLAGNDTRLRARASLALARFLLQRGDTAEAVKTLRTLEPALPTFEPEQCFEYYQELGSALFRSLRFDEARAMLAEFRAYLTAHPSVEGEFTYAATELTGAWVSDNPAALRAAAERYIRHAELRGDLFAEALGRAHLAYVKHQLHDTSGAREEYARTLAMYERLGHGANVLITRLNYGMVEYEVGHIDRAAEQWELIGKEAGKFNCGTIQIAANVNLAEVELVRGNVAKALAYARAAHADAEPAGDVWMVTNARAAIGAACCRSGNTQEGLKHLRHAVEMVRGKPEQSRTFVGYLATYVDELVRANETGDLPPLIDELRDAFDADPLEPQYPGFVSWVLARAADANGDSALAARAIERGRDLVEERARAFEDPQDRRAFLAMHPHPLLLARAHVPA